MNRGGIARRTLLLLVTCGAAAGGRAEIILSEAWVRALPPTQRTTAAYVNVHNSGPHVEYIVGGSLNISGRVEIHRSELVDGMMRMQPVSGLPVTPGETVQLAPGGVHLMLMDLERMPVAGAELELCLTLRESDPICTVAPVRRNAGAEDHSHQH